MLILAKSCVKYILTTLTIKYYNVFWSYRGKIKMVNKIEEKSFKEWFLLNIENIKFTDLIPSSEDSKSLYFHFKNEINEIIYKSSELAEECHNFLIEPNVNFDNISYTQFRVFTASYTLSSIFYQYPVTVIEDKITITDYAYDEYRRCYMNSNIGRIYTRNNRDSIIHYLLINQGRLIHIGSIENPEEIPYEYIESDERFFNI